MSATWHVAEVTDPVTGENTILTATTESELEQLIEAQLKWTYPHPVNAGVCAGSSCCCPPERDPLGRSACAPAPRELLEGAGP